MTPLQRRTLAYLATVDSATPAEIACARGFLCIKSARELMGRLIAAGHARNVSTTRRCIYTITIQGRQATAPPLVRVKWDGGMSPPLQPSTAEALRVRLDAESGPGTHRIVPA